MPLSHFNWKVCSILQVKYLCGEFGLNILILTCEKHIFFMQNRCHSCYATILFYRFYNILGGKTTETWLGKMISKEHFIWSGKYCKTFKHACSFPSPKSRWIYFQMHVFETSILFKIFCEILKRPISITSPGKLIMNPNITFLFFLCVDVYKQDFIFEKYRYLNKTFLFTSFDILPPIVMRSELRENQSNCCMILTS